MLMLRCLRGWWRVEGSGVEGGVGEGEDGGEEARQGIGSLGAKKQHAPGVRVEGEGEGEEKREREGREEYRK